MKQNTSPESLNMLGREIQSVVGQIEHATGTQIVGLRDAQNIQVEPEYLIAAVQNVYRDKTQAKQVFSSLGRLFEQAAKDTDRLWDQAPKTVLGERVNEFRRSAA